MYLCSEISGALEEIRAIRNWNCCIHVKTSYPWEKNIFCGLWDTSETSCLLVKQRTTRKVSH